MNIKKLNEEIEKLVEGWPDNKEFDALFDQYVPKKGHADTVGGELIRIPNRASLEILLDGMPIDPCEVLIHDKPVKSPDKQVHADRLSCCQPRTLRNEQSGIAHIMPRINLRKMLSMYTYPQK